MDGTKVTLYADFIADKKTPTTASRGLIKVKICTPSLFFPPFLSPEVEIVHPAGRSPGLKSSYSLRLPNRLPGQWLYTGFVLNTVRGTATDSHRFPF